MSLIGEFIREVYVEPLELPEPVREPVPDEPREEPRPLEPAPAEPELVAA